MNLTDFAAAIANAIAAQTLTDARRPFRLRLADRHGPLEEVLLIR